ncbi:hypothetical protein RIF29_11905 [Crotalaria pallida]|uniref:Uncharacterized protein n=1 Tax=Crotalaria pallida TaxID=3830 RepID=A0AAN9IMK9_CROPI
MIHYKVPLDLIVTPSCPYYKLYYQLFYHCSKMNNSKLVPFKSILNRISFTLHYIPQKPPFPFLRLHHIFVIFSAFSL